MKAILLGLLLATGFIVNAQDPNAVSLSQAEAVREFPALSQQSSSFNKRFVERVHSLKTAGIRFCCVMIGRSSRKEIGVELGIAPLVSVTASASTRSPRQRLGSRSAPCWTLIPPMGQCWMPTRGRRRKYYVAGTVIQRTADGLLIECNRAGALGTRRQLGTFGLSAKMPARVKRSELLR